MKNLDCNTNIKNVKNDEISISIFGKFCYYNKEHADWLLKYIQKYNEEDTCKIVLHHIGKEEEYLIKQSKVLNIENFVKIHGPMEYTKGMEMLSKMDILILNHRSRSSIGTKIYDYIYLNKPIIAFIEQDSVIGNFLKDFSNAYVVDREDKLDKAFQFILESNGKLTNNLNKKTYSRGYQMEKLYRILNNI